MNLENEIRRIMDMPKDPVMLLSFVNTQLRDHYTSLSELCKTYCISEQDIIKRLDSIDYKYDKNVNQFI